MADQWAERIITHANLLQEPQRLKEMEAFLNSFQPAMTDAGEHIRRAEASHRYYDSNVVTASVIMLMERALINMKLAQQQGWVKQHIKDDYTLLRTPDHPENAGISGNGLTIFDVTPNVHAEMVKLFHVLEQEVATSQQAAAASLGRP